ncbi:MAG: hypothetical protein ABEJ99_02960 [Candidatus Nanohaloarchaea archaeon]
MASEDQEEYLHSDELAKFYETLDSVLDDQRQKYNLDDDFMLYAMGGATGMLLNTPQTSRPANDIDLAVYHSNHPNSKDSYVEKAALENAMAYVGFEFTNSTHPGYEPTQTGTQTLSNVDTEKNDLPITNLDLLGGNNPLGKYPMEWIRQYSEPITANIAVLDLEGLAVRKIFRATVDRQGPEDSGQEYDIGTIRTHIEGKGSDVFNEDRARQAWDRLLDANPEKEKPWAEARGFLVGR